MTARTEFAQTPRTTLRRGAQRGSLERAVIEAILDEAFLCHVAFQHEGHPFCIPMAYARAGDAILLHGSIANHALRTLRDGAEACVTVTLVDGLVLARSAFRQSVNYRSVVIYGSTSEVTEPDAKNEALRAIVEGVIPGRWTDVRAPSPQELEATLVLRIPLVEVSAKVRNGPPNDLEGDRARDCWAGVVPLRLQAGEPIEDAGLSGTHRPPDYAASYAR
jgi:nitroimidazol reductase NimA-like FMN-containing flavoprotein (pyridoxamine 5'-phosphate oxidase superfamily)